MAKYLVNAPDGKQVAVATPYGVQTFAHGTYMSDDRFHSIYPKYFVPVVEVDTAYTPPATEPVAPADKVEEPVAPVVPQVETKAPVIPEVKEAKAEEKKSPVVVEEVATKRAYNKKSKK